jgi:hypothetical protein
MSTKPLNPATPGVAPADGSVPDVPATPSPTVTFFQQLAAELMKEVEDVVRLIPKLEVTSNVPTADFIRSFRGVPIKFLVTVVGSVEQSAELRDLRTLDPVAGRDHLQFIEAFRPASDKIAALDKSLKFAIQSRKAILAAPALQTYAMSQGLLRYTDNPALASIVANMKRDLGKRGRPKASAARKSTDTAPAVVPKGGTASS